MNTIECKPQAGPQTLFAATPADIAIYGGAAGGGKSWSLLVEPLRHIHNSKFGSVFFRRTTVQIRNEGGLWDESLSIYPYIGGIPKQHNLIWKFQSGATISFAHLEHEKTVLDWMGSQICLICFDELTHFSAKQFWYMVSRNRSMCGVTPYVRATCNPDVNSWVADFISWWIDQETGLAITERSGKLRWFVRSGDTIKWADTPAELSEFTMIDEAGKEVPIPPKSVTFIPSKLSDNKILMKANPDYQAALLALPTVERERLAHGNWKIKPAAGLYFNRAWCEIVDVAPVGLNLVRGWDLAATVKTETNDPSSTSGTKIGKSSEGIFYILENINVRLSPRGVEKLILSTAKQDGYRVSIDFPTDPGQAGKSQSSNLIKILSGFSCFTSTETGSKLTRFSAFSAQAEAGNVKILKGHWNARYISALESFPEGKHDDDVDSTSRAFSQIEEGRTYTLMGSI